METDRSKKDTGNELVVMMLEVALEKAKKGQARSALLLAFRENGEVDISGEFTHVSDLTLAVKKLAEARRTLKEMLADSSRRESAAPPA